MKQWMTVAGAGALVWGSLQVAGVARAGVPECGNLRLEDVGRCDLRGSVRCAASCDEFGVYKKACATKLQTVCSKDCVLSAEPTCTDSCTESCTQSCDRGENVICIHNCFGECTSSCDATCEGAADAEQCHATCEANCDSECDIKCKPLVDGDCYTHCVECCGGSCKAEANMDCQVNCQEKEFEDCEHELRVDCDASCSATGAIFCDGEFVLEGSDIPKCAAALAERGIADIEVSASASTTVGGGSHSLGCATAPAGSSSGSLLGLLFGAVVLVGRRARRCLPLR